LAEGLRPDPLRELTVLPRPAIWSKELRPLGRGKEERRERAGEGKGRQERRGREDERCIVKAKGERIGKGRGKEDEDEKGGKWSPITPLAPVADPGGRGGTYPPKP